MKHRSMAGTSTQGLNSVSIVENAQLQRHAGELKKCGTVSGPAITTAKAAHLRGMTLEVNERHEECDKGNGRRCQQPSQSSVCHRMCDVSAT